MSDQFKHDVQEETTSKMQQETTPKGPIKASHIIEMLEKGHSREQIAEYYGLPMSVAKTTIFAMDSVKGRKTKKQYHIEMEDDLADIKVVDDVEKPFVPATNEDVANMPKSELPAAITEVSVTHEEVFEVNDSPETDDTTVDKSTW